ncbi:hypothetical protein ACQP00_05830 [Dactylosporangium sp. CS-047395]|uniref:hypothetical protein n=1 Tax=Dactylosporangium sp. CS-047395 TaxID=3239936 RepID=UPI003D8EBAA0
MQLVLLPVLAPLRDGRRDDVHAPVLDEFMGGLGVGYSYGPPFGQRLVTWADLQRMELPRRMLCRQAAYNLDARLDSVGIHGQPPALMLNFEGIASSLLLAEGVWASLERSVPGELVVGVPARDVVIVTGSQSPPGLAKVRRAVDRVFFAGDRHLLSRKLLVRRRGIWEQFAPNQSRAPEAAYSDTAPF